MRSWAASGVILLAATLSGCAAGGAAADGHARGYGIGPVEGETLNAMLARCAADGFASPECDQLRRTERNQPGNAAAP